MKRQLKPAICIWFLLITATAGLAADPDTVAKYLAGLAVPAQIGAAEPVATDQTAAAAATPVPERANSAASPTPVSRVVPGSLIPERRPAEPIPQPARTAAAAQIQPAPRARPDASNPWLLHSTELDRAWKHTEQSQLAQIAAWAPQSLGRAYTENATMFYMFSGPDFLYAHAFFPNARTYILVGNEPVGAIPELDKIPASAVGPALGNVRKSLGSVLSWSFFITKNMKTDLAQPQLSGTLPLLYVFLARLNCTVESVSLVSVDREGHLAESAGGKGDTQGVRIVFRTGPAAAPQTLFYFSTDLSDDGIKATPGLVRFCDEQGRGVSLLKAASYLMHEPGFSRIRQFLLDHSDTIVQDDSGIPVRYFDAAWSLQFWGPYAGPIDIFKKYWQPDLAEQVARTAAQESLPFGFGYQWQPTRSNLMVAERKGSAVHAENRTSTDPIPVRSRRQF